MSWKFRVCFNWDCVCVCVWSSAQYLDREQILLSKCCFNLCLLYWSLINLHLSRAPQCAWDIIVHKTQHCTRHDNARKRGKDRQNWQHGNSTYNTPTTFGLGPAYPDELEGNCANINNPAKSVRTPPEDYSAKDQCQFSGGVVQQRFKLMMVESCITDLRMWF